MPALNALNQVLLAITCEAVFKMAAASTTSALPICPRGYGWDVQLEDCLPYSICDTVPDTSICVGHSRSGKIEESRTTKKTYVCPPGYGWNPYLMDCQACSVCDEMQDTSICAYCQSVSEQNRPKPHLGLAVGYGTSVVAFACLFLGVLWCTLVKHEGDKHKKPIQATSDGESSDSDSGLELVTVV